MKGPSGRLMTCAAYQGLKTRMLELRVSYDSERPLMVEHAANLVAARQRAAQLLETLQGRDGFELVP
jgi:hypothetical protein